ncbi:type II toxin-antitoxin system RelE family toxin [Candidatus Magnetobacterium casense]|uniref:type II toxin-antitoxin system RelE family toxin n=1 Tax=Candidatus Magnetobacterium casense TaxID=1455061 RepID=UPI001C49771F|nr:type II toxin-antitoxin system RelE/ParE family toxin [Candidatus Magnetobacterium casensis]
MSKYSRFYLDGFKKDIKAVKNNFELRERLLEKIGEVLENPHHYKPLRNILKNKRRVQIGSYVLIFEIIEEERKVVFHSICHHNKAYKEQ